VQQEAQNLILPDNTDKILSFVEMFELSEDQILNCDKMRSLEPTIGNHQARTATTNDNASVLHYYTGILYTIPASTQVQVISEDYFGMSLIRYDNDKIAWIHNKNLIFMVM
jgi:hypothetical protein